MTSMNGVGELVRQSYMNVISSILYETLSNEVHILEGHTTAIDIL